MLTDIAGQTDFSSCRQLGQFEGVTGAIHCESLVNFPACTSTSLLFSERHLAVGSMSWILRVNLTISRAIGGGFTLKNYENEFATRCLSH